MKAASRAEASVPASSGISRPRMECRDRTANNSPVMYVAKRAIFPSLTWTHFEWVPGSATQARAPNVG